MNAWFLSLDLQASAVVISKQEDLGEAISESAHMELLMSLERNDELLIKYVKRNSEFFFAH